MTPIGPAEGEALRRLIEECAEDRARDSWQQEARKALEAALAPLSGAVDASGEPLTELLAALEPLLDNANGYDKSNVRGAFLTLYRFDRPDLLEAEERARIAWKKLKAAAAVPSSPAQEDLVRALHTVAMTIAGALSGKDVDFRKALRLIHDMQLEARDGSLTLSALPPSSPVADSPTPEICICAAIQLDNSVVLRGHRHDDCFQTALKYGYKERITQAKQGFVTSRNRFVGREEGAALQRAAGIVSEHTGQFTDLLFSEDLYFNDNAASAPSPSAGAAKEHKTTTEKI